MQEYWRTEKLPAKVLCRVYTGGDTAVACLCVNRGDGGFPYNDLSFGSFRGGWGTGNGAFSSRVRRVRHVRRFGMTFLTRPDLGGPSHYSGDYLIGFEHCGAHFFDLGACLGGPSHASPLLTTQVEFGRVSVVQRSWVQYLVGVSPHQALPFAFPFLAFANTVLSRPMVIPMLWRMCGYVVCMLGVKNKYHHTHP